MTRWLDRMDKRHPIAVKVVMVVIAAVCFYIANANDQSNDTALRLQMLTASRSAT